jgi:hypothetical protein
LNLRSTIIGIASSAIILAILGVARLFTTQPLAPDLTIREVETVILQPPPPSPPIEEPPSDSPPPPPALTEVSSLPDPTRVPVPQAKIPMDITAPVENFFTDLAPAPLPVAPTDGNTRVISSTHPELVEPARNVALSARFTPPKRKGQAVKAIMQWPIVIEK